MKEPDRRVRLAAVQAAPMFLDRAAGIAKTCALIREAGANGANVVGFPEGFVPAHPHWYDFRTASSYESKVFARRLFENAVEIPGPDTDVLCAAAAEAQVFAVVGVCEREAGRTGTMYNTLLFIDSDGRIAGRHRKLMPTLGERIVHAPGDSLGLRTHRSPHGRIGGLICGENTNPLATYALDAQGIDIHVAAWPSFFDPATDMQDIILMVSRLLAYQMKVFVINAVAEVSTDMIRELPLDEEQRAWLKSQGGGASIVGPRGIIAGPLPPGETILYGDVDLRDLVLGKCVQDFAGHYNRFDVFELTVRPGTRQNLRLEDEDSGKTPLT